MIITPIVIFIDAINKKDTSYNDHDGNEDYSQIMIIENLNQFSLFVLVTKLVRKSYAYFLGNRCQRL